MDPVREAKVRAEVLHRRAKALEPDALKRLRALDELRRADDDELRAAAAGILRKHCLAAVAKELGFANWAHARRVLEGDPDEPDFGKLLYGAGWGAQLHQWFANYEDARRYSEENPNPEPRYLLAYKRHFFITNRQFIEALGLDPDDPDWANMGWDWGRPRNLDARRRLYAKRIAALDRS